MKAFPNKNKYPEGEPDFNDMDLRRYFAIHAKHNDIAPHAFEIMAERNEHRDFIDSLTNPFDDPEIICEARYRYADAMMEALNDKS